MNFEDIIGRPEECSFNPGKRDRRKKKRRLVQRIPEEIELIKQTGVFVFSRLGVHRSEGLYQSLLVHELGKRTGVVIRERISGHTCIDSDGNEIVLGDRHSASYDIDLPLLGGIVELKIATTPGTTCKDLYQLKNYLDGNGDRSWGCVMTFVSSNSVEGGHVLQLDYIAKRGGSIFAPHCYEIESEYDRSNITIPMKDHGLPAFNNTFMSIDIHNLKILV